MTDERYLFKTGIGGLDEMLAGGIPDKNQVLVAGGPGTGKTLLCFQIAYNAAKRGIPSAFIALDEEPDAVVENAKRTFSGLGDIDALMGENRLIVKGDDTAASMSTAVESEAYSFGKLISGIEAIISSNGARVVIIDSIEFLRLMLERKITYRRSMISVMSNLRRLGVNSFVTAEIDASGGKDYRFKEEFFIFDGIIAMGEFERNGSRVLGMEVMKMRGNSHSRALSPYRITGSGIELVKV